MFPRVSGSIQGHETHADLVLTDDPSQPRQPALASKILCVRCPATPSTFGAYGHRATVCAVAAPVGARPIRHASRHRHTRSRDRSGGARSRVWLEQHDSDDEPPDQGKYADDGRPHAHPLPSAPLFRRTQFILSVASPARIIPRHLLWPLAPYTDQSTAEPVAGASAERPILVVHRGLFAVYSPSTTEWHR